MHNVATTKLSSRGQVVIPEAIRESMNLHTGDQFIVVAQNDVVVLKTITRPPLDEYKNLIAKARQDAKHAHLTKTALKSVIQSVRREK